MLIVSLKSVQSKLDRLRIIPTSNESTSSKNVFDILIQTRFVNWQINHHPIIQNILYNVHITLWNL